MDEITGSFLKIATLKKWDRFPRFQNINGSDFVTAGRVRSEDSVTFPVFGRQVLDSNFQAVDVVHFISHRWQSLSHPDPDGEQLAELKRGLPDDALIWYDYSCMPQEPRTSAEDQQFRSTLEALPALIKSGWFVILGTDIEGYGTRAWCQFEAISALQYASRPPTRYYQPTSKNLRLAEQTFAFLKQCPLYSVLLSCIKALPKQPVSQEDTFAGIVGYYMDLPDLNEPAFAAFKSAFFGLRASVLADPPMLWELLRNLFPPRRDDYTYRT